MNMTVLLLGNRRLDLIYYNKLYTVCIYITLRHSRCCIMKCSYIQTLIANENESTEVQTLGALESV